MAALSTFDDQQLVALLREGNEPAFAELYSRYAKKIYAFASRVLKSPAFAADITHDVFVKLWENPQVLNPARGPSGYLFTIARNLVFNQIKRAGKESEIIDEILWFASGSYDQADLAMDIDQGKKALNDAVSQLPSQRQRIYRLCREGGFTYKEVAQQLNLSDSTVNSQMVKALKSIREYLQTNGMLSVLLVFYHIKK